MDSSAALQPYPLFGRRVRAEQNEGAAARSGPFHTNQAHEAKKKNNLNSNGANPLTMAKQSSSEEFENGERLMPAVNHLKSMLEHKDSNGVTKSRLRSHVPEKSSSTSPILSSARASAIPDVSNRDRAASHKEQIENSNRLPDADATKSLNTSNSPAKEYAHHQQAGESRASSPLTTNNSGLSPTPYCVATPSLGDMQTHASSSAAGSSSAPQYSSTFTPAAGTDSFVMISGGEINFKRNIDSLRADRSRQRGEHYHASASRTGGSNSSADSDMSANSAQHESSKRRTISPVALDLGMSTPSAPIARTTHSLQLPEDQAIPSNAEANESTQGSSSAVTNDDAGLDGMSPGARAAVEAVASLEGVEPENEVSVERDSTAASSAAPSASQQDDDMAASIALARQLMYEESMQAAQWIQRETLAAHRQHQLELANRGISSSASGGQVDEDLLMALELAEQEQHAAEHEVPADEEFDVEEMSYDQLMDLGSRIGSVAQQRWQLDAKHVVSALPTRELTESEIAARCAAKKDKRASSLALIVEDPTLCQICQCDFEAGDHVKILPCKHDFHVGCIDHWLKDNNSCVLCKKPVDQPTSAPQSNIDKETAAAQKSDN